MTIPRAKKKRFDCVEMMHEGAARVQEELAGLTLDEQAAYWEESQLAFTTSIRYTPNNSR